MTPLHAQQEIDLLLALPGEWVLQIDDACREA